MSTARFERTIFFLLFVALCLKSNIPFAQSNTVIDSLLIELQTTKADTNQVIILCELSGAYLTSGQLTEARTYAEKALQLAEKLNFQKGRAAAHYHIGGSYLKEGNYPEATKNSLAEIEIYEKLGNKLYAAWVYQDLTNMYLGIYNYADAIKSSLAGVRLAEEIGDNDLKAQFYNFIGSAYGLQGNYPESLKFLLASLELVKKTGNKEGMITISNNIGDAYFSQGNYFQALKYYFTGNELAEESGDKKRISLGYSNVGRVYKAQGNYPEALKNFQEAFRIAKEMDPILALTGISSNELGALYNLMGKYDEVIAHFMEVLKSIGEEGNKFVISQSHSNIGMAYQSKGNYPEALKHYLSARQFAEATGNKREIANSYKNLGIIYTLLHNDREAQQFLDKSLAVSKEIRYKEGIKNAYLGLSKLDSLRNNYQAALVHFKLYQDVKDSLLNETNNKEIAHLKEQYESEKKDKEILLLTNEKQQLENEKKIGSLLLKNVQSEKERVKLENEKFHALNLFNQQQLELLSNEKRLQELQSEKDKADLAFQKAESDKKQDQLNLLNKEKDLRELELKKEKLTKNYFIAGLGLFLVLSFFIYRNYQTKQEVKLLTLRNKIASDLHDDVGSTLSSISMFSQIAQTQSKEVIPALETIEDSSKKMLDAMADIVWTINPENDQFEKIIMRMRSFAFELLGAKDIDFEFDTDEDVSRLKLPMEARKNLYLIFKEATNNMVKYSQASRAKFVILGEKDKLTMVIKDNGKGFDTTKESWGNGLKNMKKRAAEMGAQLLIDSTPGIGTMIKLELAV